MFSRGKLKIRANADGLDITVIYFKVTQPYVIKKLTRQSVFNFKRN